MEMEPEILNAGPKLRKLREAQGIKQDTVAKQLNISQQRVSQLEQQEVIESEMLGKYAAVLGVTVDFLFRYDPDNNAHFQIQHMDNGTGNYYSHCEINPFDKVVGLFDTLIKQQNEKIESLLTDKARLEAAVSQLQDENNKLKANQ